MTKKFIPSTRSSRITSSAALFISFAAPFTWMLSTGLVWAVARKIPGSVSDTSISFPTGIPLVTIIFISWWVGFFVSQRTIKSKLRVTLVSNLAAVLAFCACFTFQFGAAEWNPVPDPGLINIFPIRFALAVLIAFACSMFAALYLAPRTDNSIASNLGLQ
ncbi:MAG: hypothetical protein ABI893_04200 [Polaromonas sp.]